MKDNGFTIIEVMIVLAIIGIIVAIAFGPKSDPVKACRQQAEANGVGWSYSPQDGCTIGTLQVQKRNAPQ